MSDAKTLGERELIDALQGDQAAIRNLADRIYDRDRAPTPPADDGRLHLTPDELRAHDAFVMATEKFKREYRDLVEDEHAYRLVVEADAAIARQNPTMPFMERLRAAGNAVRQMADEQDDGDERYRAKVVEHMKATRGPRADGDVTALQDPDPNDYGSTTEDDFDAERAEAIAEMKRARRVAVEGEG